LIQLGTVQLTVTDENGFIGVQRDPFALRSEEGKAAFGQLVHSFGFVSRPLDPVDGRGCGIFFDNDNREEVGWLASDLRLVDKYPPQKKGGSCQYAADGQFANMDPELHTWSLYVPYSSSPAKAHLVTVGKDGNGKPIVELSSGAGPSFTLLDKVGTWSNASGSSYITLDDGGTSVIGPFKAAGGADIGGPSAEFLVKFAALQAHLIAVQAALSAIAGVPIVAPAASAPVAAATATLAAFGAAGHTNFLKGA
jgi:hypothetical protein